LDSAAENVVVSYTNELLLALFDFLRKQGGSIADGTRIEAAKTPRGRDLVSGWERPGKKFMIFLFAS